MIYLPERDTDLRYLLGPFDAKRMIRLEGAPLKYAAGCATSFADVQRRFPSVDRNITYLSWSAQVNDYGLPGLHYGAVNDSWSAWPRRSGSYWIADVPTHVSSPEGVTSTYGDCIGR